MAPHMKNCWDRDRGAGKSLDNHTCDLNHSLYLISSKCDEEFSALGSPTHGEQVLLRRIGELKKVATNAVRETNEILDVNKKLATEVEHCRREVRDQLEDTREAESAIAMMKRETNEVKAQLEQECRKHADLCERYQKEQSARASAEKEVITLRTALEAARGQLARQIDNEKFCREQMIQDLEKELDTRRRLEADISDIRGENVRAEGRIGEMIQEEERLRQDFLCVRDKLEQANCARKRDRETAEKDLAAARNHIYQLQQNLAMSNARLTSTEMLEQELQQTQATIQDIRNAMAQNERCNQQILSNELDHCQETLMNYQSTAHAEKLADQERLQRQVRTARDELAMLHSEASHNAQRCTPAPLCHSPSPPPRHLPDQYHSEPPCPPASGRMNPPCQADPRGRMDPPCQADPRGRMDPPCQTDPRGRPDLRGPPLFGGSNVDLDDVKRRIDHLLTQMD